MLFFINTYDDWMTLIILFYLVWLMLTNSLKPCQIAIREKFLFFICLFERTHLRYGCTRMYFDWSPWIRTLNTPITTWTHLFPSLAITRSAERTFLLLLKQKTLVEKVLLLLFPKCGKTSWKMLVTNVLLLRDMTEKTCLWPWNNMARGKKKSDSASQANICLTELLCTQKYSCTMSRKSSRDQTKLMRTY